MADPAPKTRDWSALENAHKPRGLHIIVCGLVEVNNTNLEPQLAESAERNPKNLGLDLTIKQTGGPGLAVKVWKGAYFHREVKANEFDNVIVRWHVDRVAEFPVINDREYGQHLAALMVSANAKYGKKPKKAAAKKAKAVKKTAKKVAKKAKKAKKATAVSRAVKAVGGWAKGAKKALKKLAKKAPKKAAKKAAKKAKKKGRR